MIAGDDDFYFSVARDFAICRYQPNPSDGAPLRCDAPLRYAGRACQPERAVAFTLSNRREQGVYLCGVESVIDARGRDVEQLAEGDVFRGGDVTCWSAPGPALRCENRHGNGFELRADTRVVF